MVVELRRALIAESLKQDPQLSNREHERRTGASRNTVGSVREELEAAGELSQSDSRVSADGRVRPASQPPRVAPALLDRTIIQERRGESLLDLVAGTVVHSMQPFFS